MPTTTEPAGRLPGDQIRVVLPAIPVVALPDLSILGETGQVVEDRLGELITPTNGLDLVAAECAAEGGELVYGGSTGNDVFEIERDGSGRYYEESDDGLVTLEVSPDGSGRFYDASGTGLVTIEVGADGSGQYYREEVGKLVTVSMSVDGDVGYYDDREGLLTVTIGSDGSGEYYQEIDDRLVTIDVAGDGSGEFYQRVGEEVTTIDVGGDGSWVLSSLAEDHRLELTVAVDGSGRYVRTGLDPIEFGFGVDGSAPGVDVVPVIVLPPTPRFTVSERVPALGSLGALAPPCAAVLRFDASVLFEFAEVVVRPEADETLDQVAAALIRLDKSIRIEGHTDSVGSDEYNLDLSLQRGEAVAAALRARGLQVEVEVVGHGESRPVAPNETADGEDYPAGRALNRRVEIIIPE